MMRVDLSRHGVRRSTQRKPTPQRDTSSIGDTSNKFWEITLSGMRHSVRFGRIGAAGQEAVKEFADEKCARQESEALIRQKLAKGYREVTSVSPRGG
jgi:predicted DNA-binding WGR domain protein